MYGVIVCYMYEKEAVAGGHMVWQFCVIHLVTVARRPRADRVVYRTFRPRWFADTHTSSHVSTQHRTFVKKEKKKLAPDKAEKFNYK